MKKILFRIYAVFLLAFMPFVLSSFAVTTQPVYASVAQDAPVAQAQSVTVDARNRVIGWYIIGWSSPDPALHYVGPAISVNGWPFYVQTHIQPAINNGVKRILLHNPFGIVMGQGMEAEMQFDQYLEAKDSLPKLVENFVETWKPITQSGVEVIGYIGSPWNDSEQVALQNNPDAWWARAWQCVQPLLDAGMSVGLDAIVSTSPNSLDYAFAQALKAKGVRVYVESRPGLANPNYYDYPVIILEETWQSYDPDVNPSWWAVHNDEINEEVVRLIRYDDSANSQLKAILGDGNTGTVAWYSGASNWTNLRDFLLKDAKVSEVPTLIRLTGSSPNGKPLTYGIANAPSHGTLIGDSRSPSKYTYIPYPQYSGDDFFGFKVNDGSVDSAPAEVTIHVNPLINQAQNPIVQTIAVKAYENSSKTILLTAKDGSGNALTYQLVSGPAHGTLTSLPNAPGDTTKWIYTLDRNYEDSDTFVLKTIDNSISLTLIVNRFEDKVTELVTSTNGLAATLNWYAIKGAAIYEVQELDQNKNPISPGWWTSMTTQIFNYSQAGTHKYRVRGWNSKPENGGVASRFSSVTQIVANPKLAYGDVSTDGEVTGYDAAIVAQASVGLIALTADQIKAANVNGDKDTGGNDLITANDAALIAQRAVGLINKFPAESG